DEMNFHWDGTRTVMNMYETDGGIRPVGKDPISIDVEGEMIGGGSLKLHVIYEAIYGVKHQSSGGRTLMKL
ncbi:MAG: hypothetical protein ACLFM1_11445, partial [Bacteroidales bacterium]